MQLTDIQQLQSLSNLTFSYIKSELTKLNNNGKGLGQIKLAELTRVNVKTINSILHGRIDGLKTETLVRMATHLIELDKSTL
jgi:plasmid maintenance system antidote protein VapI